MIYLKIPKEQKAKVKADLAKKRRAKQKRLLVLEDVLPDKEQVDDATVFGVEGKDFGKRTGLIVETERFY